MASALHAGVRIVLCVGGFVLSRDSNGKRHALRLPRFEGAAEDLAVVRLYRHVDVLGLETEILTGEDVVHVETVAGAGGETEIVELAGAAPATVAVVIGELE